MTLSQAGRRWRDPILWGLWTATSSTPCCGPAGRPCRGSPPWNWPWSCPPTCSPVLGGDARRQHPLLAISRRLGVTGFREPVRDVPKVLFASGAELTDPVIRPGALFLGTLRDCDAQGLAQTRGGGGHDAPAAHRPVRLLLSRRGPPGRPRPPRRRRRAVDRPGRGVRAPPTALAPALTSGSRPPLAVVLSVCHSAVTARTGGGALTGGRPGGRPRWAARSRSTRASCSPAAASTPSCTASRWPWPSPTASRPPRRPVSPTGPSLRSTSPTTCRRTSRPST